MPLVAVLDACVLIPAALRDVLLRAHEAALYRAHWSEHILDEVERNLAEVFVGPTRAAALVQRLRAVFPDALVPIERYEPLISEMTNQRKDRHVLAAAVAANAAVVVTRNLRDFPDEALSPYGIRAQSPDAFLLDLFLRHPAAMAAIVQSQASDLKNPPATVERVLDTLTVDAPRFVASLRAAYQR